MTTSPTVDFKPNYATPTGYTLEAWLEENEVKQIDFARRLNMSPKTLNQILHGIAPITSDTARKLEYCTGIPTYIWNNLEAEYRRTLTRLAEEKWLNADSDILNQLPMSQMRKRGIITCKPSDVVGTMREVLSYFQVADAGTWHRVWTDTSPKREVSAIEAGFAGALATWLRQGEIESAATDLAKYSPRGLNKAIKHVKSLAVPASGESLFTTLKNTLAEVGIGLVAVETFQGADCSNAIQWVARRPVIILSTKLKSPAKILAAVIACLEYVLAHPRTNAVDVSA